jgi:hypothetical protein
MRFLAELARCCAPAMSETPLQAGFSMLAEWAPHACAEHALVAREIAHHEPVRVIANP